MHIPPLLVVLAAAVAAPVIGELTRRFGLSIIMLELALGVLIGPSLLGIAHSSEAVGAVAGIGMAFLFFLAGMEIDLAGLRGKPIVLATLSWGLVFGASWLCAQGFHWLGLVDAWQVLAIALSTTALGILMPMLRDSGQIDSFFGRVVVALGVVGEFGPILLMALLLSQQGDSTQQTLLVPAFAVIVVLTGWALLRGAGVPRYLRVLERTLTQTSQLPVRVAMLVLAFFAVLAETFGLDLALGALAAGLVIKLALQGKSSELLHHKLEGIGFGFLVPVFFINSGMKLEVGAVFGSFAGFGLCLAFLIALLLVHLPVALCLRFTLGPRPAAAAALYSATTLSLIVALTEMAGRTGLMSPREVTALVLAGVLSVVVFPLLARRLLAPEARSTLPVFDDRDSL